MKKSLVTIYDKAVVLVMAAIIAAASYIIAVIVLKTSFAETIEASLDIGLKQIEAIDSELIDSLNQLNRLGFTECNGDNLKHMRRMVFVSQYIKDIGFIKEGYLHCTTGLGELKPPVIQNDFDFTGPRGIHIWIDIPILLTNREMRAFSAQLGSYNAIIHREFIETPMPSQLDWQSGINEWRETLQHYWIPGASANI
jgi:sensor c-di-GMP phosphodiesterase-like protein